MSSSTDTFRKGDIVSYKYNGMRGEVTEVLSDGRLDVTFPSQNRSSGKLITTLSLSEVELISGGSTAKLVSA